MAKKNVPKKESSSESEDYRIPVIVNGLFGTAHWTIQLSIHSNRTGKYALVAYKKEWHTKTKKGKKWREGRSPRTRPYYYAYWICKGDAIRLKRFFAQRNPYTRFEIIDLTTVHTKKRG